MSSRLSAPEGALSEKRRFDADGHKFGGKSTFVLAVHVARRLAYPAVHMIRRGNLTAKDRTAAYILALACVVLGMLGIALGALRASWSACVGGAFIFGFGI